MRLIKQDTFPTGSYSFVSRFSKWGSLFKARALSTPQVWELCSGLCLMTAARAWPHVPSCTHTRAVLAGTALRAEEAHLWELRVTQGDPHCSRVSLWRSRTLKKSLSSLLMSCVPHVLLCKPWNQGCWLPGSSCLEFMANSSCNVQLSPAWSPADRGALTGPLRGHGGVWQSPTGCRAPLLPRLSLPRSKQCLPSWECYSRKQHLLPNTCSHGSRFHAGCFPKHEQLEYFCYISLPK